jgi:hypothetical protein
MTLTLMCLSIERQFWTLWMRSRIIFLIQPTHPSDNGLSFSLEGSSCMTRLACRKCRQPLLVPDANTGQLIRCPACGTLLYRPPQLQASSSARRDSVRAAPTASGSCRSACPCPYCASGYAQDQLDTAPEDRPWGRSRRSPGPDRSMSDPGITRRPHMVEAPFQEMKTMMDMLLGHL